VTLAEIGQKTGNSMMMSYPKEGVAAHWMGSSIIPVVEIEMAVCLMTRLKL
jgi:hypothetical protein